jgi:hypothetical protein
VSKLSDGLLVASRAGSPRCDTGAMDEPPIFAPNPPWDALLSASQDDKERWLNLWLEEYRSIRSESEQARNAQQTILQWSLAAFAGIIAGSLLMFEGSGTVNFRSGEAGTVLLFVFGVGLPSLGFFSYLVWWGEFLRMERAGRYARGLEVMAARVVTIHGQKLPPPLQWEHFLAGPSYSQGVNWRGVARRGAGRSKQLIGYVGTAGIYFGFSFASLILFVSLVLNHAYGLGLWTVPVRVLSLIWCLLYVAVFGLVSWYLLTQASRQSREGILLPDVLPKLDLVSIPLGAAEAAPASSPSPPDPIVAADESGPTSPIAQPAASEPPQSSVSASSEGGP